MQHRSISAFVLTLLLAVTAAAQTAEVDAHIRAEMEKQRVPGLSLAVVKDGKIVRAEGYGTANLEHNIAARPETVYKIGSISKQFLAAGILVLAQDGKLSLGDPVHKYFTDAPETWRGITIRHLLLHTSGLPRESPAFNPFQIQPDAELIKAAYKAPLLFAPGTKWEYCNLGYFMLAEIILRVSGRPWTEFMTQRVFAPVGMKSTRETTVHDLVPGRADGYVWRDRRQRNADDFRAVRASGAFISTVLDLAKWEAALDGDQVLKAETRTEMWKPTAETPRKFKDGTSQYYGYGWFLATTEGRREIFHGGSLPGFRAFMIRYPDERLTIIILANGDGAVPEAIARSVAGFYLTAKKSGQSGN